MTDVERLHLVKQLGGFMGMVKPEEKREQRGRGVTVNVNSPDNYIVTGDRIEINIHVGGGAASDAEKEDGTSHRAHPTAEIRELLASAIEQLLPNITPIRAN